MATNRNWFPNAREARYAIIVKTTAFMDVLTNRAIVGFDASTPNGVWYDSVYGPRLKAYTTAYDVWANPATSTRMALDDLKDAEKEFFPLYRNFYGMMRTSALVTDAFLEGMGFPPRPSGGHEPHPADLLFISLHVAPLGNAILSVGFENRDTESSAIPYYLDGAVIYYSVSDTPVVDPELLPHSRLASRSPFELVLAQTQRGQTVYLAARWQNNRGELGPWSDIYSTVVP
jgi:hypothetical protein